MVAAAAHLKDDEVDLVFEAQGPEKGTSVDAGARQVTALNGTGMPQWDIRPK